MFLVRFRVPGTFVQPAAADSTPARFRYKQNSVLANLLVEARHKENSGRIIRFFNILGDLRSVNIDENNHREKVQIN